MSHDPHQRSPWGLDLRRPRLGCARPGRCRARETRAGGPASRGACGRERTGPRRSCATRRRSSRTRRRSAWRCSRWRSVAWPSGAWTPGDPGAAEDALHGRPGAPRRREREGPLPRPAPGRDASRLPHDQPGQGVQPRLRRLLRELRRARREAHLGHGRPHRARRPRRLGYALLRALGRRAARVAREPQGRPRARRGAPRLLLHHVLERHADRRRAGPPPGRARQPEPGALDRGDEGPHRRAAGRGRVRSHRGRRPSPARARACCSGSRSPPRARTPKRSCPTRFSPRSSTSWARSTRSSSTTCRSGAPGRSIS